MFYLQIKKIKFLKKRELIGKAEVKLLSFVNTGESNFPMLKEFFNTNDEQKKNVLIKEAMDKVMSARDINTIEKVKKNQEIQFGDTGYTVFQTEKIPADFNWMLFAIELDEKSRKNAEKAEKIVTPKNITKAIGTLAKLANMANPVATAIKELSLFAAAETIKAYKNDKDDQLGLLYTSFIRKRDYPDGIREGKNVKDSTGNMFFDYSIYSTDD